VAVGVEEVALDERFGHIVTDAVAKALVLVVMNEVVLHDMTGAADQMHG